MRGFFHGGLGSRGDSAQRRWRVQQSRRPRLHLQGGNPHGLARQGPSRVRRTPSPSFLAHHTLHSCVESPILRDSIRATSAVHPGLRAPPTKTKVDDCIAIDAAGDCPSLPIYGHPTTWDTSQVTDMDHRALPHIFMREGANSTLVYVGTGAHTTLYMV